MFPFPFVSICVMPTAVTMAADNKAPVAARIFFLAPPWLSGSMAPSWLPSSSMADKDEPFRVLTSNELFKENYFSC